MYQGKPEENPENREEMFSLSNNEEDKELFARNKTTLHKLSPHNHEVTESVNKQLSNVFNASFSTITHSATPTLKGADLRTHIRKVPCHPAAQAVLVPYWRQITWLEPV